MAVGTAPGKAILFGEHAAVYGRPAIAVPITKIQATAELTESPAADPGRVRVRSQEIGLEAWADELSPQHPLARITRLALAQLAVSNPPGMNLDIRSTIPIAAGLGSGVAVSIAVLRAFAAFFHQTMSIDDESNLAWEVEKIHHGTPSGIDNTVVAHGRTVYFVQGHAPEFPALRARLYLAVGDSGQAAPTAQAVAHVRAQREAAPAAVDAALDRIGEIVDDARRLLEAAELPGIGRCMHENHTLLQSLGVSTPTLDRMADAAEMAGALGAKLTGAGRGGNLIALLASAEADEVEAALRQAGARRVFTTEIAP